MDSALSLFFQFPTEFIIYFTAVGIKVRWEGGLLQGSKSGLVISQSAHHETQAIKMI